jgi:hypothetical protein
VVDINNKALSANTLDNIVPLLKLRGHKAKGSNLDFIHQTISKFFEL